MQKIRVGISFENGQIILTPPFGVEFELWEKPQPHDDDLITVAKAAEVLGLSAQTVSRYCTNGTLRSARKVGGNYLISWQEVADLSKKKIRPGRPKKG